MVKCSKAEPRFVFFSSVDGTKTINHLRGWWKNVLFVATPICSLPFFIIFPNLIFNAFCLSLSCEQAGEVGNKRNQISWKQTGILSCLPQFMCYPRCQNNLQFHVNRLMNHIFAIINAFHILHWFDFTHVLVAVKLKFAK